MTVKKAQKAINKAKAQTAKARESFIKAIIVEAGANPRKVRKIKVDGFRSLLQILI